MNTLGSTFNNIDRQPDVSPLQKLQFKFPQLQDFEAGELGKPIPPAERSEAQKKLAEANDLMAAAENSGDPRLKIMARNNLRLSNKDAVDEEFREIARKNDERFRDPTLHGLTGQDAPGTTIAGESTKQNEARIQRLSSLMKSGKNYNKDALEDALDRFKENNHGVEHSMRKDVLDKIANREATTEEARRNLAFRRDIETVDYVGKAFRSVGEDIGVLDHAAKNAPTAASRAMFATAAKNWRSDKAAGRTPKTMAELQFQYFKTLSPEKQKAHLDQNLSNQDKPINRVLSRGAAQKEAANWVKLGQERVQAEGYRKQDWVSRKRDYDAETKKSGESREPFPAYEASAGVFDTWDGISPERKKQIRDGTRPLTNREIINLLQERDIDFVPGDQAALENTLNSNFV